VSADRIRGGREGGFRRAGAGLAADALAHRVGRCALQLGRILGRRKFVYWIRHGNSFYLWCHIHYAADRGGQLAGGRRFTGGSFFPKIYIDMGLVRSMLILLLLNASPIFFSFQLSP
jgi:hypothetical protein